MPQTDLIVSIGVAAIQLKVSKQRLIQLALQNRIKIQRSARGNRAMAQSELDRLLAFRKKNPRAWPEATG